MPEREHRPVVRILVYLAAIILLAVCYLAYRRTTGLTLRNVVAAVPVAILCAVAIWLRWDVAPRVARKRRAAAQDQVSARADPGSPKKP